MSIFKSNEHLLIGYHQDCGKPIYSNDFKRFISEMTDERTKEHIGIYKCLTCNKEAKQDDLIPF